jgi:hypothetical protein
MRYGFTQIFLRTNLGIEDYLCRKRLLSEGKHSRMIEGLCLKKLHEARITRGEKPAWRQVMWREKEKVEKMKKMTSNSPVYTVFHTHTH